MEHLKRVENPNEELRKLRAQVCFPIINRGKLWYDSLSIPQLCELKRWYKAWLNVTDTGIVPVKPTWLEGKIIDEEILL